MKIILALSLLILTFSCNAKNGIQYSPDVKILNLDGKAYADLLQKVVKVLETDFENPYWHSEKGAIELVQSIEWNFVNDSGRIITVQAKPAKDDEVGLGDCWLFQVYDDGPVLLTGYPNCKWRASARVENYGSTIWIRMPKSVWAAPPFEIFDDSFNDLLFVSKTKKACLSEFHKHSKKGIDLCGLKETIGHVSEQMM